VSGTHEVDLVVQVVNYRTKRYLPRCLDSVVAALDGGSLTSRVLVLENGSSEDLSDLASRYRGRVALHTSDVNLGFGGGHNLLASRAASSFLCCVNPDVVVTEADVFERLLESFRDPAVAIAGPLLRTESGRPQIWDHGELAGIRARVANGAGHAHWIARRDRCEAAWVSGAFMLARRSAFAAVGGFDERYFLYKEEEDLCLRLRRSHHKVVYDPTVEVTHSGGVVAARDERQLAASMDYYVTKNLPNERRRRLLEVLYLHGTRRLGTRPGNHWLSRRR
jgi:N-acetylglucosaminyl-diphospho-decaprenol L-rhamnosyltransferase